MEGDKPAKIQTLNPSETEVLHVLFRDPDFKVKELAAALYRSEQTIRGNLTAIFKKLDVPDNIENKREYVVREYSEAYEYVFDRELWESRQSAIRLNQKPEIYIRPPEPVVVEAQPPKKDSEPPQIIVPPARINYTYLREEIDDLLHEYLDEKVVIDKKEHKKLLENVNGAAVGVALFLYLLVGLLLGVAIGMNWDEIVRYLSSIGPR